MITEKQTQLVQSSFAKVAPIAEIAADLFYARLFELDPDLRKLFRGDMKSQGAMLMSMLSTAVRGLSDSNALIQVLMALGRRHSGYGVKDKDYTTVGSALVWNRNLLPLELGDLPYEGGIIEEVLGKPGLELLGKKIWQREVHFCVDQLRRSLIADYVVLGGGNAKFLSELPPDSELGHNRNAYLGGVRMWEPEPRTKRPKWNII
jgi:hemoglobin-like flavoprotein